MKSKLVFLLIVVLANLSQGCRKCCPSKTSVWENDLELKADSMASSYYWINENDTQLIDFGSFYEDVYYSEDKYFAECGWNFGEVCDKLIEVKTLGLIGENEERVIQLHFYEKYYSPYSNTNGSYVKLTLRTPEFKNDATLINYRYYNPDISSSVALDREGIKDQRIKSIDFTVSKGLKKVEFNDGLQIISVR